MELTDEEKGIGYLQVLLLPGQAEAINELLELRGYEIGPPTSFGFGADGAVRVLRVREVPE